VARIEPIEIELAEGKARELLDELVERGGELGPMVRAMANRPRSCAATSTSHEP
jgi:hypothetical protein